MTTRAAPSHVTWADVRLRDARSAARDWVAQQAGPGLVGAFLTGSAAVGPDDRELPATSDVDVVMVTRGAPATKIGKLWHTGVLLDVSSLAAADLDAETIAGTSHLAPFFRRAMIIDDPTGRLARLQAEVAPLVDRPDWIRRRVGEVRAKITTGLAAADPSGPLAQQVIGWVFPASLPTVLLLVAAGRPPTVRSRYLRCRELLADTGRLDLHERLLDSLGCGGVRLEPVRHHLTGLADTLCVTAEHARTPFPFSGDLRPDSWHIALDGSAELIEAGWHREAVWWLLATFARCVTVLAVDAPAAVAAPQERRLAAAAGDLIGFHRGDGPQRAGGVRALLPAVDALAEELIAGDGSRAE